MLYFNVEKVVNGWVVTAGGKKGARRYVAFSLDEVKVVLTNESESEEEKSSEKAPTHPLSSAL